MSALQDCKNCRHYFITHDRNAMYGCRAFSFKSPRQPILEVTEASGEACQGFEVKPIVALHRKDQAK